MIVVIIKRSNTQRIRISKPSRMNVGGTGVAERPRWCFVTAGLQLVLHRTYIRVQYYRPPNVACGRHHAGLSLDLAVISLHVECSINIFDMHSVQSCVHVCSRTTQKNHDEAHSRKRPRPLHENGRHHFKFVQIHWNLNFAPIQTSRDHRHRYHTIEYSWIPSQVI